MRNVFTDDDCPSQAFHLWEYFVSISNARREEKQRLSRVEIEAWARLAKKRIGYFELNAIDRCDTAYLEWAGDPNKNRFSMSDPKLIGGFMRGMAERVNQRIAREKT